MPYRQSSSFQSYALTYFNKLRARMRWFLLSIIISVLQMADRFDDIISSLRYLSFIFSFVCFLIDIISSYSLYYNTLSRYYMNFKAITLLHWYFIYLLSRQIYEIDIWTVCSGTSHWWFCMAFKLFFTFIINTYHFFIKKMQKATRFSARNVIDSLPQAAAATLSKLPPRCCMTLMMISALPDAYS